MSTQTVAFLVGIGLLFVAILGGGITAKDVTIPPLPILPRLLCGVLGAVLFVFGLGLTSVFLQMASSQDSPSQNGSDAASSDGARRDQTGSSRSSSGRSDAGRSRSAQSRHCQNPPSQSAHDAAAIEISDRLGPGQVYERIDLTVAGSAAGTLCVDRSAPQASIWIPPAGPDAAWRASGSEATALSGGVRVRTIEGEGTLDLSAPARYSVRSGQSTPTVQQIWLRPF